LANVLFWLGDIAGTIANCEKANAGFRRRGDPMFVAGAALSLVGYNKGYLRNTAAGRGWLSRAARIIDGEVPEPRGELLGATAYVTDDPVKNEALARHAAEIGRTNGNSYLEQDGEQAGNNQAICPSSATALPEPGLPGALRPSATRCHHRGLYLSRNAMTDRLGALEKACHALGGCVQMIQF
jgi:hypothetical protein